MSRVQISFLVCYELNSLLRMIILQCQSHKKKTRVYVLNSSLILFTLSLTLGPQALHFSFNRFTGMSRRNGTRKLFKFAKHDDAVLNSIEELNTGLFTTLLFVVCVALPHSPTRLGAYAKKNGDGNNNGKKSNRFKAKQQLCTCITHFCT